MYVAEFFNSRVQVLDSSGHFIRAFGEEGEGKLSGPAGLHIADKHVYVSDCSGHCIVVYETSSPDLVGLVRRRVSCVLYSVSPLVLMVLFMYVTLLTTELKIGIPFCILSGYVIS